MEATMLKVLVNSGKGHVCFASDNCYYAMRLI
jgi:hypothetical protein